ncbi:MAG: hypothetical protein AAB486_04315 [Patescibacteria group bacterium]
MTKYYLLARKIHRYLVIIMIVLSLIMAGTGILLKYSFISAKLTFIDLGLVRFLHNNLSPFFSFILFLMAVTGSFLFLFPYLPKRPSNT